MGFQTIKASQGTSSVQSGVSYEENVKSQNAIPAVPAVSGRIEETVISVGNQHRYGQLFIDNLKARKTVFIDQKSWDLPHTEGMEFDQYDTPQSRSVVIHEYGRVLAGVRLLPTTARCGCYSYMLRDAQLGMLPDIPDYVLYEKAPVMPHVWEATRLFVNHNEPADRRLVIQTKLIKAMARAATEQGATHVIGIVPAVFQRWMNRLGLSALPMGPKLNISGDNTQAAVMHVAGQVG
jgi:acyl homoserine lactone synthase